MVFYQSFQGATGAPVITLRLKELASINISCILYTLDTFHLLIGWLKEVASRNIHCILSTLDTSQSLIGWLKEVASQNKPCIFVTFEVSQVLISPYFSTILFFLSPPTYHTAKTSAPRLRCFRYLHFLASRLDHHC